MHGNRLPNPCGFRTCLLLPEMRRGWPARFQRRLPLKSGVGRAHFGGKRPEYWDLPNMFEARTDGDAHCDACYLDAERFSKFGKLDVNFAKDMVAGFVLLASMIPSSLKKPGNTQRQRAVKQIPEQQRDLICLTRMSKRAKDLGFCRGLLRFWDPG